MLPFQSICLIHIIHRKWRATRATTTKKRICMGARIVQHTASDNQSTVSLQFPHSLRELSVACALNSLFFISFILIDWLSASSITFFETPEKQRNSIYSDEMFGLVFFSSSLLCVVVAYVFCSLSSSDDIEILKQTSVFWRMKKMKVKSSSKNASHIRQNAKFRRRYITEHAKNATTTNK